MGGAKGRSKIGEDIGSKIGGKSQETQAEGWRRHRRRDPPVTCNATALPQVHPQHERLEEQRARGLTKCVVLLSCNAPAAVRPAVVSTGTPPRFCPWHAGVVPRSVWVSRCSCACVS